MLRLTRLVPLIPRHRNLATLSTLLPPHTTLTPEPILLTPSSSSLGFEATPSSTITRQDLGRPIYLDMQATTPTDPRVLDAMLPYMTNAYGNPHSKTHAYGWETEKAVEEGRQRIAELIGADKKDIVFTSGATESNNMSIKGVARFFKGKKNHMYVPFYYFLSHPTHNRDPYLRFSTQPRRTFATNFFFTKTNSPSLSLPKHNNTNRTQMCSRLLPSPPRRRIHRNLSPRRPLNRISRSKTPRRINNPSNLFSEYNDGK